MRETSIESDLVTLHSIDHCGSDSSTQEMTCVSEESSWDSHFNHLVHQSVSPHLVVGLLIVKESADGEFVASLASCVSSPRLIV